MHIGASVCALLHSLETIRPFTFLLFGFPYFLVDTSTRLGVTERRGNLLSCASAPFHGDDSCFVLSPFAHGLVKDLDDRLGQIAQHGFFTGTNIDIGRHTRQDLDLFASTK